MAARPLLSLQPLTAEPEEKIAQFSFLRKHDDILLCLSVTGD